MAATVVVPLGSIGIMEWKSATSSAVPKHGRKFVIEFLMISMV